MRLCGLQLRRRRSHHTMFNTLALKSLPGPSPQLSPSRSSVRTVCGAAASSADNDRSVDVSGLIWTVSVSRHPQRLLLLVFFRLLAQVFDLFLLASARAPNDVSEASYLRQGSSLDQVTFSALELSVLSMYISESSHMIRERSDSCRRTDEVLQLAEDDMSTESVARQPVLLAVV